MSPAPPAGPVPVRSIALLAVGAFVSAATLRVADPLLPQVAEEFGTSVGDASIVATGFTLAYGLCQIFYGPLGDRFGKYGVIAVATFVAALGTAACAAAESLPVLGALRLASGATAGAIIPLAIAHIGDIVPYERRQPVLARFISGQMFGIVFGQAFGGALIEHVGWRGIFLVLGAGYLAIAALLLRELRSAAGVTQVRRRASGGLLAAYLGVVRIQWVRVLVSIVFAEGFLLYGGAAYFGAYLRHDFGLGYTLIGGLLACFGIGALIYSATAPFVIARLGETGLVLAGGALMAASYWASALLPAWQVFAPVIALTGAGFYMMHNTLQTNGTQMAPHARGLAMSVFATCLFLGQAFGVAVCGWAVDAFGYRPVFAVIGALLLALAAVFRGSLVRRARGGGAGEA